MKPLFQATLQPKRADQSIKASLACSYVRPETSRSMADPHIGEAY